nr:SCP2 sterol-binding domain-containing protein [Nocardia mexicana]
MTGLPLLFQRGQARGMTATYHFTFTGAEQRRITVAIHDGDLDVTDGHQGEPDMRITADSRTWLRFLAKRSVLPRAILLGRLRIHGSPKLLLAFARCFPT